MDIAPLLLAVLALALAAIALALVVDVRTRTTRLADHLDVARRDLDGMQEQLNVLKRDVGHAQRELDRGLTELGELKAATNIVPALPPLPRTRGGGGGGGGGGLDELRQRLRAAHSEEDPSDE